MYLFGCKSFSLLAKYLLHMYSLFFFKIKKCLIHMVFIHSFSAKPKKCISYMYMYLFGCVQLHLFMCVLSSTPCCDTISMRTIEVKLFFLKHNCT